MHMFVYKAKVAGEIDLYRIRIKPLAPSIYSSFFYDNVASEVFLHCEGFTEMVVERKNDKRGVVLEEIRR